MIGTFGYVMLMHWRSPVAWLGHKRKWMRLREGQRRLLANRHYPEIFPPVSWMQLVGLRDFEGDVPQFDCRYSFKNEHEVFHYLMSGFIERWKRDWKRYLFPSRYGRPSDIALAKNPQIAAWYRDQGHQITGHNHRILFAEIEMEVLLGGALCGACRSIGRCE